MAGLGSMDLDKILAEIGSMRLDEILGARSKPLRLDLRSKRAWQDLRSAAKIRRTVPKIPCQDLSTSAKILDLRSKALLKIKDLRSAALQRSKPKIQRRAPKIQDPKRPAKDLRSSTARNDPRSKASQNLRLCVLLLDLNQSSEIQDLRSTVRQRSKPKIHRQAPPPCAKDLSLRSAAKDPAPNHSGAKTARKKRKAAITYPARTF
ncbi:MAG: hypothetical protein ACTTIC_05195 [Helicobacteraceae bacterium]